ncbi:phosphotransferase [Methylomonas sp. AM2-LC]|uniref:aminoglycoside phosphotransferase family protein n=1 Tax=Methylomonas sp. AM2-LC TaxID=3153301 RepID=UPI003265A726
MSLPHSDLRVSALINWLSNSLSLDIQQLEIASSDASFRRYFRVKCPSGCHIVMDAPPDKENTEPFLRIAALFKAANLRVPDIYFTNIEQGFIALEDFGSSSLLDCLAAKNVDQLYQQALQSLLQLQTSIDINKCALPTYDTLLLERELGVFHDWFLENLLGLVLPVGIKNDLHDILIQSALAQPQVCVHRDYHSRNLMLINSCELGIIDFQDAVIGPISYDAASLLRDCYIRWPTEQVDNWIYQYYLQLIQTQLLAVDFGQFKRWFDLMGLQRHLKAIGIFSRLHLRDGKSAYLDDIPRTLSYISEVCANYAELSEFNRYLQQQIAPIYRSAL